MSLPPSFYLGPKRPRLVIEQWGDLVSAAAAGVLDETYWVELKQAIPPSSKPANLELARDLASLSVDGGVLVIGIADAGGAAGEVIGTDLDGLADRIAQVAAGRVSPPLSVSFDAFSKPGNDVLGVLVVHVPASASAPHMVDGHYWGRAAAGKRKLEDHEVRRLLSDRQMRDAGFEGRLLSAADRLDAVARAERQVGRMYLLLEPAAPLQRPLIDTLSGQHLLQVVVQGVPFTPQWSPSMHSLNYNMPHPDGLAAASTPAEDGQDPDGMHRMYLLLSDDGSLQLSAPASRPYGREADPPLAVFPGHLLETAHSAVVLAGFLADRHTGYTGAWRLGVHVDQLRGLLPSQAYSTMSLRSFAPFQAADYTRTTEAVTRELVEDAPSVVARLLSGLLRGLGVESRFLPYSDPAEFVQRTR